MKAKLLLFIFLPLLFSSDFLVSALFVWPLDGGQGKTLAL